MEECHSFGNTQHEDLEPWPVQEKWSIHSSNQANTDALENGKFIQLLGGSDESI